MLLQGLLHGLGQTGHALVVWTVLMTWLGAPLGVAPRLSWAAFVDVTTPQVPPTSDATHSVVMGDVTGEGAPDVVVVSAGQSRLFVNDGQGQESAKTWGEL
jgi:hypothetical protein